MYAFVAAIWLGKFRSEGDLAAYMDRDERFSFPEPSLFARDAGMAELVDDLVEFAFHPQGDLDEMLSHFSYSGFFSADLKNTLAESKLDTADTNAMIIVFGLKSQFGDENLAAFSLPMQHAEDTPLIPIGKFYFEA